MSGILPETQDIIAGHISHDAITTPTADSSFLSDVVRKNHNSFSKFYFSQTLYNNQIDILNAITSPTTQEVVIVEPRQAGKTSSLSVGCAELCEGPGEVWNKNNAEPYRIGIFGPKLAQAQIDTQRIKLWANNNPNGRRLIDWKHTTNSVVKWHNGSEVHAGALMNLKRTYGLRSALNDTSRIDELFKK